MARTVTDVAILLGALTGIDAEDAVTVESSNKTQKDYTKFLALDGLNGKRIGIEKSSFEGHEAAVALYNQAIEILKKQGATVIEVELNKAVDDLSDAEFLVLKYEFKEGLNKYLAKANAKVKSLADVILFNRENETLAMPFFKQELMDECEEMGTLESKDYAIALEKSLSSRKIINDMMNENKLDAIAGVTAGLSCCVDLVNGDYGTGFYFSAAAAMAGYPHITVPMGRVFELPVGLSFISGAYKEAELLTIAYSFEQATKKRAAPKFKNTVTAL